MSIALNKASHPVNVKTQPDQWAITTYCCSIAFFNALDVEQDREDRKKEQRRKRKGKGIYHHVNSNMKMQFVLTSSLVPTSTE